ncbi:C40 family peptidase [Lactiplantibacillus modestisalitolerans]|uniref:LysM peptidoglycan-binding domain-containing protein n=1 Tax=Lactiplantibacillus modestisalitolerans TaxID=1457219 RepID=A0ABV5WU04_9LACO|nr:C40 family peptidase [Lactiplantibacillus modestisalitolerans]
MSQAHTTGKVLAGTVGAVGLLLATGQAANAASVTVNAHDTVWDLAQQHGVSVKSIEQLNKQALNGNSNLIYVGQKLQISGTTTKEATKGSAQVTKSTYKVQTGDTLWALADKYNTSVHALQQLNGIDGDLIVTGQAIKVPATTVKAAKTQTPASQAETQTSPAVRSVSSASQASVSQGTSQATSATTTSQTQATTSTSDATSASSTTVTSASSTQATSASATQVTSAAATSQSSSQATSTASQTSSSTSSQATSSTSTVSSQSTQSAASTSQASSQASSSSSVTSSSTTQQPVAEKTTVSHATATTTTPTNTNAAAATQTTATSSSSQATSSASQSSSQATSSSASQAAASSSTSQATTSTSDLATGSVTGLALKLASANIPYVWGGSSLSGMDCSGLVAYVYQHAAGISLPHNTIMQESYVTTHSVASAQPGDILFWGSRGSTYHDAIYIGNNQFVAAPQPGENVKVQTISSYFMPSFAGTVK